MPEKPDSSNKTASRGNRRGKRRLPVLPIVLLLVVAFVVLSFVTFRQLRSAREHRLRLLAGFGDRIELTIPQLTGRFARIIQDNDRPETIEDYIRIVPHLQLVGDPRKLEGTNGRTAHEEAQDLCAELTEGLRERVGASAPCLVLQSHNDQIELVYVGVPGERPIEAEMAFDEAGNPVSEPVGESLSEPVDEPVEASAEPDHTAEGQTPAGDEGQAEEQDEDPRLAGPHVFFGRIALRPLLREILIADVFDSILVASARTGRVLHQEGEPAIVVADLSSLLARSGRDFDLGDDGPATAILDVTLGPPTSQWLKEGSYKLFLQPVSLDADLPGGMNVAAEDWIAGGLISDEKLLASGFSTSPLLLFLLVISFPSALVFWPFLKLWLISPRQSMTRFDVAALVASSLLGLTLVTLLVFDLLFLSRLHHSVDGQLKAMAEGLKDNVMDEVEAMSVQLESLKDRKAKFPADRQPHFDSFPEVLGFLDEHGVVPAAYPYFHSIFWADAEGEQTHKLPLREYALFTSEVRARWYFQCARRGEGYRLKGSSLGDHRLCIEPIFSNTTGRDLVALARSGGEGGEVAVLTTVLLSLRQPPLAPGFGFAVVDESGLAVFHSDPRRNMTEDFLKASDEDRLLAALLDARRPGHLTLNYWGDRSRLYLLPLEGLPWTLVAYRSTADLRLRNFEVIYDFFAGVLPYLLVVLLILLLGAFRRKIPILWPTSKSTGLYRLLVLTVAFLTGFFALAVAFAAPAVLFRWSLTVPVVCALVAAAGYLWWRKLLKDEFEDESARTSTSIALALERVSFLLLLILTLTAFAMVRGFINGFLLVAAISGASTWRWVRSYFLHQQRRLSFIAALGAVLFAVAVLPAVGFFHLAASRQLQYLVQDTQAGLARAIAARDRNLLAIQSSLGRERSGFFAAYGDELKEGRRRILSSFFGTERVEKEAWQSPAPDSGSLWPVTRGENPPFHMTLLSARPAPPSEIAASRLGLDLSRFDSAPHEWRLSDRPGGLQERSDPEDSGGTEERKRSKDRWIVGRFAEPWETGEESFLASILFSRSTTSIPPLRFTLVTLALLLLVPLPWIVARFLADRVLLARLASVDTPSAPLDAILENWGKRGVDLRRVLLVTSVPELALREAKTSGAYQHKTFVLPEPPEKTEGRADNPPGGEERQAPSEEEK